MTDPGPTLVSVKVQRPGHTHRWHTGARLDRGPLTTSEACNLDQASIVEERLGLPPSDEVRNRVCRRCYPDWPVPR